MIPSSSAQFVDTHPDVVGTYGCRWTSSPVGAWEITASSEGIDVWTHPFVPLTAPEARAMAVALAAAGQPDEEDAA